MEVRISQRYDIPIPLLKDNAATYNNFAVAQFAFYHDAILPHADLLLGELTAWLMPKFKNSENLVLTYDASDIPALRLRNFEEAKVLRQIASNTDNEIRTIIGYENIEGGDVVFKPANQLPMDTLANYADTLLESNDGLKSHSVERFVKAMMLECNSTTGKAFTRDEA